MKFFIYICISTENFLKEILNCLNITSTLQSKQNSKTKQFSISNLKAFNISKYLYSNANIYLTRKYNIYLQYCRLYEKSYKLSEDNIGEGCDANTEITKRN